MNSRNIELIPGRRGFLFNVLKTSSLICCINHSLFAQDNQSNDFEEPKKDVDKFKHDSKMTWEEVFQMSYSNQFIPFIKYLANQIGKEDLINYMKQWIEGIVRNAPIRPDRGFSELVKAMTAANPFSQSVLTQEIVENSETAFEMKTTECLWAKTFREAKAEEYGYAYMCYPDLFKFLPWNSKLRVRLTKTLMQGDACCNHRFYMEA